MALLTLACYSFEDPGHACARLRLLEPARVLGNKVRLLWGAVPEGEGHRVRKDILDAADVILIQRLFPCPRTAPLLHRLFTCGKPLVYDTDDDWGNLPADHPFAEALAERLPLVEATIRRADRVTVSTPTLAEALAGQSARVRVLPNYLPEPIWRPTPPPQRSVVAVGLAATPSHRSDLIALEPALSRLAERLTGLARWVFYGCPPTEGLFPGATVLPFDPPYGAYAARLPRLGLGVGLAPLADTLFNRAKSPIKWMEYAACGLAGVFADLPPYRAVVEQEQTGLLVGPDPRDWSEAVERLVRDTPLRRRLASQAWEAVCRGHRLADWADAYLQAWQTAGQEGTP